MFCLRLEKFYIFLNVLFFKNATAFLKHVDVGGYSILDAQISTVCFCFLDVGDVLMSGLFLDRNFSKFFQFLLKSSSVVISGIFFDLIRSFQLCSKVLF